ncbi:conserved exported hypothetical protein [Rhizobium mesoamericanum STM3625]|uniref:Cysteine rich repeat domain protein n=2 Tax=Rhizobium mesoamericanum TaxID=1079800 RepID=K0PX72_9HYPH|nr:conserved exported hypothetical protein [Rhizobium mesoamericanum STM3625]
MEKRSRIFSCALLAMSLAAGVVRAETISFADAVSTLVQACGTDIKKHCRGVNLADHGVQQCLQQHQAEVSPSCTTTLSEVTNSIQLRLAAQASVTKICSEDAARVCHDVAPGEANLVNCLARATEVVGKKCSQAITDAGWR